ncbi:hypothetical protein [Alloactinosynnema sp. L-07]|uniref:hypothetical protein n=1 Tax=Alloactinosynnema sp. L-07 TaxID=1653480 RepID=UPI00065F0530|nr:hypothetical protein [Alloactinosynnema sp. L-07]CRK56812.1 hypothetical protein [Alloactinosynnema sp. L-07]
MSALRPYLIVLAGHVAAIPLVGFTACLWSLAGTLILAALDGLGESLSGDSAGRALAVVIARLAIAVGVAALLFIRFDWVAGAVFIVLLFAFWATKENFSEQADRKVDAVRVELVRLATARASGEITADQFDARADVALTGRLPRWAYIAEPVATRLARADSLTSAQHRLLLAQLARHAKKVNPVGAETALEKAIRAAGR